MIIKYAKCQNYTETIIQIWINKLTCTWIDSVWTELTQNKSSAQNSKIVILSTFLWWILLYIRNHWIHQYQTNIQIQFQLLVRNSVSNLKRKYKNSHLQAKEASLCGFVNWRMFFILLIWLHTDKAPPSGDNDKFSTVARSSSTLAEIGADPLFNGLISTWILRSRSSLSESLSESDSAARDKNNVIHVRTAESDILLFDVIPFFGHCVFQRGSFGWMQKPSSSTSGCCSLFGVCNGALIFIGVGVGWGVDSTLWFTSSFSSLPKKETYQIGF